MFKNKMIIIIFSSALLLQGCSLGNSAKTASTNNQKENKTQSVSSTAKSSGDSNTSSNQASTDVQSSAQNSTNGSKSTMQAENSEGEVLLKKLYETSKSGNIPNCNFSSNGTLIQTVEKTWGKPDKTSIVGKDTYYTYNKYGVVFGVRKDSKIFDIRLYGKNFDKIRYDDIENTLGKPAQISHYKGEDTIIYNVNKYYQFMLIFYTPDDNNSNPTLQYISVSCSKVS